MKHHKSEKLLFFIVLAVILVAITVGVIFFVEAKNGQKSSDQNKQASTSQQATKTSSTNTQSSDQSTSIQSSSVDNPDPNVNKDTTSSSTSQSSNTSSSTSTTATITVVDASQYNSNLEVRAYADVVESDGTFTINFSGVDHNFSQSATQNATNTICTIDIPVSFFPSSGNYTMTINYKSSESTGTKTQQITVNK